MTARPWVLGISCSHNAAACLLHGDEIVAAVQEERLVRFKRQESTPRFARYSIDYCLQAAGISPEALDLIVYSVTRGVGAEEIYDISLNEYLRVGRSKVPVLTIPHHYGHAVSAFATSGFDDAAVLVIDGAGARVDRLPDDERAVIANPDVHPDDWEWLSYYEAEGTAIRPVIKQVTRPHGFNDREYERYGSLGTMYGAIATHLFRSFYDGAGKVMGLAPYGRPTIPVDRFLEVGADGVVRFSPEGYRAASQARWPDDFQACADVAASVQAALEHALLAIVAQLRARSRATRLCYAGGVALNSVANEALVRTGGFDEVFIFPAAEDSGVAVGAAYHGLWHLTGHNTRRRLTNDALGRTYDTAAVDRAIAATPTVRACHAPDPARQVARLLADGKIVGWFAGRSELGPRSLGQRTILCDPRRADGKDVLNARVKHRESFRPFAPVVLREAVEAWFDVPAALADSPFMLRVWPFRPGQAARVPAVAHVDGTARVQTIARDTHPELYAVVAAFAAETGVPILLNTSFNVAGEPIVETPEDALWCLLGTGVDCCVFGDRIVHKPADLQSMLDLRPQVAAKTITLDVPVIDGRVVNWHNGDGLQRVPDPVHLRPFHPVEIRELRADMQRRGYISRPLAYAVGETAWGEVAIVLTEDHVKLLELIDGRTDGHGLLKANPAWDAAWLDRALVGLSRASLIRLS